MEKNKAILVGSAISIMVVVTLFAIGTLNPVDENIVFDSIDEAIQEIMDSSNVPGASVCTVKDGEVVWSGTYGYADVEQNITVSNETVFMLGSISKTITGVAFMQLYEDGLVGLDDDINDHLSFDIVHPQYPDVALTPRMILSHCSGIADNWLELAPLESHGEDSPISLYEFVSGYLCEGGEYYDSRNYNTAEPGTLFQYTNVGATLIGYLVQVISNTPFEQYCQENIFQPLNMTSTSWFLANFDEDIIANPYRFYGGSFSPISQYSSPMYPCGFLRTNALQLAQHLLVIMQGGHLGDVSILNSTTIELMMTLHYPEIAPAMGLFLMYTGVTWGHGGSGPGCRTQMVFDTAYDVGVIVLTNIENAAAGLMATDILTLMRTL